MATRIPGRRLLHSPGPTPLPDKVLHALMRQPLDMGDHPRLDATIAACEQGLREVLCTAAADVFFFISNGHGAWEACIVNLLPPGAAVLIPGTGHFSESWAVQAEALRRRVVRTPWGVARKSPLAYRKFCGTPPQTLLAGLEAALALIRQAGLPQVLARHRLLMQLVHAAVQGWAEGGALDFFGRLPASRSSAVTTITVPAGTDVDALRAVAREDSQAAFAGALGPLQGRGFRIGHLGDRNPATMLGCLGAVEAALQAQRIPIGSAVQRAAAALARSARAQQL